MKQLRKRQSLLWIFVLILIPFSSCDVLQQMEEAGRFAQCNFSLEKARIVSLAGINLQHVQSKSDIHFKQMLSLTDALMKGSLPATMNILIKANNPNTKKASISGLDWEVYMKEVPYANGKLNRRVEVLPSASAYFPLQIHFDILKILTSDKLNDILALVTDNNKKESLQKLNLKVSVKPWYQVGSETRPAPAFITIRP